MKKMHEFEKIKDLKEMINKSAEKFGDKPAYRLKIKAENNECTYKDITYKELKKDIDALGTALIELGLKDKKVAVISENRYEWAIGYLAVANGTGIIVPLDKALPPNEIESLMVRSGVEAIFYSEKYDEIMQDIKERNTTDVRYYISMDLPEKTNGVLSQKELIEKGKALVASGNKKFIDAEINNEEMGIMLFTSGTTSKSKAVMLSHKNICSNIMDIAATIKLDENDIMLSFLPLHHTFECTTGFLYPLYSGTCIAFCEGIRHIAENIKEYQISVMVSVPALCENMYRKIMKGIEKSGKLAKVQKGVKISNILLKFGVDKRKEIFSEIHEKFGGKLRLIVCGAADLDKEVEKGFNDLGITVSQGYGLTETSPVIASESDFYRKLGSVGKVFPSLKVKIANKDKDGVGEVIVKGPTVMLGYYNNDEANKECLKDGWFYTGDLGYLDKEDFLHITGRKKDVIVLKNGKNVYPEELENLVNRIDGVKESMIYGIKEDDGDSTICVKIVYDKAVIEEEYKKESEEDIKELLWQKVKEINKTMPKYKYIKKISITEEELIKTTTQKIKRHEEMKKILQELEEE